MSTYIYRIFEIIAMYEYFEKLLMMRGLKPADVTRGTGISSTVFTEWKKGKSCPKTDKLLEIARFLNTSVEYLMTGQEPRYSEEYGDLLADILMDDRLVEAIKKYMTLSPAKKDHVLSMINLLSEE